MKRKNLLITTLAASVAILLTLVLCKSTDESEIVLRNIMTRTSIRTYQDRPVEPEKVELLLRAAMAAPSAGNKQPWKFVVIRDREILRQLAEQFHTLSHAAGAPMAIVVCGDTGNVFPDDGHDYWVEDVSAAAENILLAAHGLGLGAVWCGIYPMKKRVSYVQHLLQLPAAIVPLNVMTIGYPGENPAPKDKWKPENIRYVD